MYLGLYLSNWHGVALAMAYNRCAWYKEGFSYIYLLLIRKYEYSCAHLQPDHQKKNQLHHFLLEQVCESTDNCECSCPRQLLVEWLTAVWGFGIVERCYCRFILHILKVWRIKKILHNYFPNLLFPLKVCMSFYSFVCFFWRKWQGHLKCALHSV